MSNVKFKKAVSSPLGIVIQLILMMLWATQLISSDSYYVNYALLIAITSICGYRNYKEQEFLFCPKNKKYYDLVIYIFAILYSFMVSFANYNLWAFAEMLEEYGFWFKGLFDVCMTIIFFAGSFIAFWNVFNATFSNMEKLLWKKKGGKRTNPKMVFFVSFVLLVLSRWIVLWYCKYPGELSLNMVPVSAPS